MRALRSRVRRVEKAAMKLCACPCGGRNRVQVWLGDGPKPGPCARCGMPGKIIHIVRGTPPEREEGEEVA